MSTLVTIANCLFRIRAAIATVAFVLMVLVAKPIHSLAAHMLVLCGLAIRIWAAGYVGMHARKREFVGDIVVRNGPYRLFRHPLYAGNFFLVLGVIIMYNPPAWLSAIYVTLFVIMYATIVLGELEHLRGKPTRAVCYKLKNLSGEISTWLVLAVIYCLYFLLLFLSNNQ